MDQFDMELFKIRSNLELKKLYKGKYIIDMIQTKRLQWFGHLEQMSDERAIKEIYKRKPEGRRKAGHPRKRWLDEVEEDLKRMKVRNWKA